MFFVLPSIGGIGISRHDGYRTFSIILPDTTAWALLGVAVLVALCVLV